MSSCVLSLARLEFDRLLRSRGLWLMTGLLAADFFAVELTAGNHGLPLDRVGPNITLGAFQQTFVLILGLGSVFASFRSITAERESGSLKFHLAMPQSRNAILWGKILGRTAALCVPVGGLLISGAVAGSYLYGVFDLIEYLGLVILTVWYVLLGVSVGTAISASVRTGRGAAALTAVYSISLLLWTSLSNIGYRLTRAYIPLDEYTYRLLLFRSSPSGAYNVLTNALIGVEHSSWSWKSVLENQRTESSGIPLVSESFETTPLLLEPWVPLVMFLFWTAAPLLVASIRFRSAEVT